MAGRGVSSIRTQIPSRGFMNALSSAALEWLLMFMLFINAFFSYLITKFARYYELPVPCLLCSRLDHLFKGESAGFYWDLFCGDHKSEISSLVLCIHHGKLVDVHGMCESCLFSFATTDKSNAETYRLLVGKLGAGPDAGFDEDPIRDDHKPILPCTKRCCCCNDLWTSRSHAQELLLQTKSTEFEAADLDVPLYSEFRQNLCDLNKERKRRRRSASNSLKEGNIDDALPHFGYTELKINSDTESEVQMSDNEDSRALTCETNDFRGHVGEESLLIEPQAALPDNNSIREKPSVPQTSELQPCDQSEIIEPLNDLSISSTRDIGQGLEELDWQQSDHKVDSSPPVELINVIDNVAYLSNTGQFSADLPIDSPAMEGNIEVVPPVVGESSNIHGTENAPTATDKTGSKTNVDLNDGGSQNISYLDLFDAYKLAVSSSRGRQLSGKLINQEAGKDSTRVSEDLKLLLSQLSAARGLELPQTDMPSPGAPVNLNELKKSDSTVSIGFQILQKRLSLERNDSRSLDRNESGFESLDFSSVGEIEGESDIDRLRRQVEHDKKLMSSLCRELEEERNASAIAANQAMAMITRLQEEKAALQMDALHDLRMMEEEAEYDMEALQKANDLIAEKAKEIEYLEAELEFYRTKYPDDLAAKNAPDAISGSATSRDPTNVQNYCVSLGENKEDSLNNSPEFEDETLYIAQCLGQLEKKLYRYSNNGAHSNLTNGEGVDLSESKCHKDGSQATNEVDENVSMPRDRSHLLIRRVQSFKSPKSFGPVSLVRKEDDLVALGHEVSNLNDRLQSLEADRRFLQHAINSLRNGDDGLHLIQEIASHLRELRRAGIKRKQILT